MKAIIVGAGGTTRELLRRLGEQWEVTVIDLDSGRLDAAAGIRVFEPVVGDGSSPLILDRSGIDDAAALVAASDDDDRNLAAVQLALDKGLLRVVAVASDPERLPDYRSLGVAVYAPDQLTARHVELEMEPRRVASTAFAQGKAEALEFVVTPDSPVHGKKLRDIHSRVWVVAAILRDDELVVPSSATELLAGDRVTVVGAAADFTGIVNTFTSGESRFPLNYGRKVGVVLDSEVDLEKTVPEAMSLVRNSRAEELMVVHRNLEAERDPGRVDEIAQLLEKLEAQSDGVAIDLRPVDGHPHVAFRRLIEAESVGVVAVAAPTGRGVVGRFRAAKVLNTYGRSRRPVLLCRGSHPYSSILVPARRTVSGETAGRTAIDLARTSGASLVGVSIIAPTFVTGPEAVADARVAAAWLREEASVQGVHVRRKLARGNPVREIERIAVGTSLAVLSMPSLPLSWIRPGITGHLIDRLGSSILLIPGEM